jgi:3-hydroxyisobutyrate dehydrogenase
MSTRRLPRLRVRMTFLDAEARAAQQNIMARLLWREFRKEAALKIGIAGTGRMGSAIAGRLLGAGNEVHVWNRTPGKAKALEALGASVEPSAAALATRCAIVITILTDAHAVEATYNALLSGEAKGKLFIEMSTVRPETEQALNERVRAKGAAMVDCPVGGSVGPAKDGKLFGFAGGDDADVQRARPLLEQICRRVEHVGSVGAGARMKLAINLPLLVYWQALAEALALCRPLGIEPARLMDILADTSGAANVLKTRGPSIAATLQGKETSPVTVDIEMMRKDLRTMVEEAKAMNRTLPVTAKALECYDDAVKAGWGGKDITMLPTLCLGRGPG